MNDAERDAWLREALRHAPDAGAAPPPLLSDAILAKARAAAAEAAPPATPRTRAARPRRRIACSRSGPGSRGHRSRPASPA